MGMLIRTAPQLVNITETPEIVARIVLVIGIFAFWLHKLYEVLTRKGEKEWDT